MTKWLLGVCSLAALSGCVADVESSTDPLRQRCGGFAGTACPDGYACVDDPRDSCDPNAGGADCGGICRRERRTRCDYNDPTKSYVSRDADQCATIRFICAEGQQAFFDDCGCGCQDSCTSIGFCIDGYVWDDATCGCVPAPGEACGPVNCAAGEVCCNFSCGICTQPGGFCTQQACVAQ